MDGMDSSSSATSSSASSGDLSVDQDFDNNPRSHQDEIEQEEDEDELPQQRQQQHHSQVHRELDEDTSSDDRDDDDDDDDEDDEHRRPKKKTQSQEAEKIIRHECDMPSNCPSMGSELYFVKLPNFLSIDSREYDPEFYEDEIDEFEQLDNEGRARLKLKVENTIRWRKHTNEEGKQETQSNARVVEWSDGSRSLHLGSEIFDINEKSMGECSHLFIRQGLRQGLQGAAIFKSKLSIRPNSTESFTHRKLTLSLADRSQKTQKIRMLNNPGQDPEQKLSELIKREDDKMKATMRRETKQRRVQERSQLRGPDVSTFEPDMYDDDEDGVSLMKIKRQALSRPLMADSDESSDYDEDAYSDDSDPEFGKIKRKSDRKAKQVVEDSDDE